MPRASNGVYSLPSGNPVVTGTTIASTWANTTLSDVATAITDSLDRSGFGGMLASLQLFAGTAGSPGLSWSVETNSGLYRSSAGVFRYSIAATDILQLTNTQLLIGGTTAPGFTSALGTITAGSSLISTRNTSNSIEGIFGVSTTGSLVGSFTNHPFEIRTNNAQRISVAAAGNVTINAPSSGTCLSVTGIQGTLAQLAGPNTGAGWNINFFDTTNSVLRAFIGVGTNTVGGAAITDFAISPGPSGSVVIGTANGGAIGTRFGPNGNVTISAPSGGTALSVSCAAATIGLLVSGASLEISNSGGPELVLNSSGANFGIIQNDSAGVWSLAYGTSATALGTQVIKWTSTGAVTIPTPASGVAFSVSGVANTNTAQFTANSTSGQSFGPIILGGTTSADYGLSVRNQSGSATYFQVRGDGVVLGNDGASLLELGYRGTPLDIQTVNYTLVASDRGKTVQANGASGQTITVPSGVFGAGDVITILCTAGSFGTGTCIIVQGAGMTLAWLVGTNTSGNRTLASPGIATIIFTSSGGAFITGSPLT